MSPVSEPATNLFVQRCLGLQVLIWQVPANFCAIPGALCFIDPQAVRQRAEGFVGLLSEAGFEAVIDHALYLFGHRIIAMHKRHVRQSLEVRW